MQTLDALLQDREARNLTYMSMTRILLSALGISSNVLANSAASGELRLNMTLFIALWGVSIIVNGAFLWELKKKRYLRFIGYTGIALEVLALWAIPEIWYRLAGDEVPLGFFFKFPITMYCFITLAISCLAMRPQYPAIITGAVVLNHLYYFVIVVSDPATKISQDMAAVHFGPAVSADLFITNIVLFLLTGGTLIFFTHLARNMVYEAARMEHQATTLREQQNRMLLEGKMDSLKGLVAGFTHEINTPIGVIRSGLDFTNRCAQKIAALISSGQTLEAIKADRQFKKSMQLLNVNTANAKTAAERISAIVGSLKNFARLDEAEFQIVNLHQGLDSILTLMEHEYKDRIRVIKAYGDLPEIGCKPTEINQVFNNLLTNAVQAIKAEGTITITTAAEEKYATIKITDTGIGMSSQQMEHIFEPAFSKTGPRVKVGLGLFSSYHIIKNHQGELRLESQQGGGTSVFITLPYGLKSRQVEPDQSGIRD